MEWVVDFGVGKGNQISYQAELRGSASALRQSRDVPEVLDNITLGNHFTCRYCISDHFSCLF